MWEENSPRWRDRKEGQTWSETFLGEILSHISSEYSNLGENMDSNALALTLT